jgi:CheY-like chemotaxis protein
MSGRRVLVVDDNVDGAESLANMLQISGHEIRTAHSGPAALDAARPFIPEVVFLDIGLPGMNGYEVAKRLRAEPTLGGAVLVALTGWGSDDDKRRSREAGFDFHLTKPVELTAIERILARVVAGGR